MTDQEIYHQWDAVENIDEIEANCIISAGVPENIGKDSKSTDDGKSQNKTASQVD